MPRQKKERPALPQELEQDTSSTTTNNTQVAKKATKKSRSALGAPEISVQALTEVQPALSEPEASKAAPQKRGRKAAALIEAKPEPAAAPKTGKRASKTAEAPAQTSADVSAPEETAPAATPRQGGRKKKSAQAASATPDEAVTTDVASLAQVADGIPETETTAPLPATKSQRGRRKAVVATPPTPTTTTPPEQVEQASAAAEVAAPSAKRPGRRKKEAVAPPADAHAAASATLLPASISGEALAELESGALGGYQQEPQPPAPKRRGGRKAAGVNAPQPSPAQAQVQETPVPGALLAPAPNDEVEASEAGSAAVASAKPGAHAVSSEVRDLIVAQLRKVGRPVHVRDFERTFTRQGREKLGARRDLASVLEDLAHSGDIIRTRRHTYGLPEAMNLVRGRFQASSGGFGFVVPDSGGEDFYIREGETLEAWNGDTVLIRPEGRATSYERPGRGAPRRNDSPRAAVVRIVTRAYSQLVGSLEHQKGYAFLKPDDHRARHRIMLVQDGVEQLPSGARLVTQLFWPEDTGEDEVYGEIVRVLGNEDDPETETQAVIVKYGLHDEFDSDVLQEAARVPTLVPEAALRGRLDLRDYNIFTVDGRDAKDFDDAIHIQATPEGTFVVGVHIADVSHYVTPGSALDTEAYARATSVYLPGKVLPMLPEHLSNGVCSLVPYEDRLTMSAMLELSADGEVLTAAFTPSVIRSKARLTYDEVQAYSEAAATLPDHARMLEGDLHLLLKITAKLRQKRLREGSLDFKLREVKVDVGPGGHMELIPIREETARGMIEDLMLLANQAVAHYLLEKNVPALFRIHEEPTLARFQEVSSAIGRMGLAFPGGEPTPQAYQAVLKAVRGTGQESAVNTLLLRSMQQAKYAEENLGHFGLAFEEYLHFTSPIRRYPDLLVHRALKDALAGPVSERQRAELAAALPEQGRHTSERERTAAEAERDLTKYYQAKWAQEHLGENFVGRVSGVIASGLFVVLDNGVEGRLHISNLGDDYYVFIEEASILKGRSGGRIYRIGEELEVTVSKVNPLARQIDFTQENSMDGNDNKPRARRREDREVQKREKLSSFLPQREGHSSDEPAERASTEKVVAEKPAEKSYFQRREGQAGYRREGNRAQPAQGQERGVRRDSAQQGYRRRVVTLDRPRNEHLRPVNVTVQRMYFGDWTLENMPPEEGQGERRSGSNFRRNQSFAPRGSGPRQSESPRPDTRPARAETGPRTESSEEAKRRRRRRGRRNGSGPSGQS